MVIKQQMKDDTETRSKKGETQTLNSGDQDDLPTMIKNAKLRELYLQQKQNQPKMIQLSKEKLIK